MKYERKKHLIKYSKEMKGMNDGDEKNLLSVNDQFEKKIPLKTHD